MQPSLDQTSTHQYIISFQRSGSNPFERSGSEVWIVCGNGAWSRPCILSRSHINYKWTYNPYKWPYSWVTGVITPLIVVITPVTTGRGPPCRWQMVSWFTANLTLEPYYVNNHNTCCSSFGPRCEKSLSSKAAFAMYPLADNYCWWFRNPANQLIW